MLEINKPLHLKIKQKIDEYLEFDSDLLFYPTHSGLLLTRIFGGAIRDSIADQKINDIDLLCGSRSLNFIDRILTNNGYYFAESLQPKDLSSIYKDIRVIFEPHTWIKGSKIIQVIRPSHGRREMTKSEYESNFVDLISNVDISACGVSWNGQLHENYPNAIIHCQNKVFSVNRGAKMYSHDRIDHRIQKLYSRGWEEIPNDIPNIREQKINNILNYKPIF